MPFPLLFVRLPTGFVPNEDQGVAALQYTLPPGATLERTAQAARQIEDYLQKNEAHNIYSLQTVAGGAVGLFERPSKPPDLKPCTYDT